MADDYYTCPNDVFDDERLVDAPLSVITGHVLIVTIADDWGLFDGSSRALARKLGAAPAAVDELLAALEDRHLVRFYEAPGRGGALRRVGQVIDYHTYRGHPHRVAYESKRGASEFPLEDGTRVASRRERGSDVEATRKPRGRGVEALWQKRGSDVEATRKPRGSVVASRAREVAQHSTEQHSTASSPHGEEGSVLASEAPVDDAPPQPGPGGAGQGRTQIRQPDTAPAATSPGPPPSPPVRPVEERPPDCPPDLWEALTHPRPQTELEKRCLSLNPRDYDATNREFRAWAEERNTTHRALRDWVASVQAEQSHGRRKVLIHAGPPADSWPRAQPASAEVTA